MTFDHSRVFKTAPRTGWFVGAVFLLSCPTLRAADPEQLVPVDGNPITASVQSIQADAVLLRSGRRIPLDDLRRIVRPKVKALAAVPNNLVSIRTQGGGRIFASSVLLQDDRFTFQSAAAGKLSLLIDDVRAVRFPGAANALFAAAVREPDDEFDQFFAVRDGKVSSIRGYVEGISETHVKFEWNDQAQQIPKSKTYGLVLAAIESTAEVAKFRVQLNDGSVLAGTSLETAADAGAIQLKIQVGSTKLVVPWASVAGIGVRSERVVYLSELIPQKVEEEPIAAFPRGWRSNRNVTGGRLQIGEQSFSSGIGMQPLSTLTWDVAGRFVQLNAVIGIDHSTQGRGDCEFVVKGDGRELVRQRVRGSDPPRSIQVSLKSIRRLELIVEPGNNLDFFDHANWCDACLISASSDK